MPTVLYALTEELFDKMFHKSDRKRIEEIGSVLPPPSGDEVDKDFLLEYIGRADVVVTSWGTPACDADVMQAAENLQLLCHAGGSVKPVVSEALWKRGVRVTSAAAAISFGVAEFCLGLILLAPKRAFWAANAIREGQWLEGLQTANGPLEIYQETIGIIGASHVGRRLMELLQPFNCDVLLYDPYCTDESAAAFGARRVDTLDELFEQSLVVSLNAPSTEETCGMIRGSHFQKLRDGGVFINTARGAIVQGDEMIAELQKGRFLACLDVTEPEPPQPDSPLRSLPNVWLTPHEAGAIAQNLRRIGTFVADEITAFTQNAPLHYEITQEQLANIA
jgi:phosphoglycerate dehydrogenase-like enzyme